MESQKVPCEKRCLASRATSDSSPDHLSKRKKIEQNFPSLKDEKLFGRLYTNSPVRKPPVYTRPTEIGTFGYNDTREFVYGSQELKYFYPVDLKYPSLSDGYDKFNCRDTTKIENLDGLLKFFIEAGHPQQQKSDSGKFVMYRGVMTRILCLLYNKKENFSINATLFNGVIYINELKEDKKINEQANQTERQKLMSFWGYKFETLSTVSCSPSDSPEKLSKILKERIVETVNNHNEHCSVFTSSLDKYSLIMGAEVDCLEESETKKQGSPQYVELKTSRIIENARQESSFERFKLLKFWAQSYLAGIPEIVVGFRDDDGMLKSTQSFKTLDIPRMVQNNRSWDSFVCLDFAKRFLDFLFENITVDDPRSTYLISYDSVSQEIKLSFNPAPSQYKFLTENFIDSADSAFIKA